MSVVLLATTLKTSWGISTAMAGYLALFVAVGLAFIFVNLLVGRFLRPANPHPEKLEIYECGEPAIGSSFVQFDLRFYVVALVFIIFDVEVAFLFPWATVFGKANNLSRDPIAVVEHQTDGKLAYTLDARAMYRELGIYDPQLGPTDDSLTAAAAVRDGARELLVVSIFVISFFFFVLLVGLAYEWRTGALDWVRAISDAESLRVRARGAPAVGPAEQPVLSA